MNYRTRFATLVLTGPLSSTALAASPGAPKAQDIHFAPGTRGAELKGAVKGYNTTNYRAVAGAGQTLSVEMKPSNASQY